MSHLPTKDWRWPEGQPSPLEQVAGAIESVALKAIETAEILRLRRDRDDLLEALEDELKWHFLGKAPNLQCHRCLGSPGHHRLVEGEPCVVVEHEALIQRVRGGGG